MGVTHRIEAFSAYQYPAFTEHAGQNVPDFPELFFVIPLAKTSLLQKLREIGALCPGAMGAVPKFIVVNDHAVARAVEGMGKLLRIG